LEKNHNTILSPGRRYWNSVARNWQLYLFLLPAVVYFIIFHYIPMYGVTMAFKDFNIKLGIMNSPWADPLFKSFLRFFNSRMFGVTVFNTLRLSLYGLIAGFPIPIILAVLLNEVRSIRYKKLVQNVTYAPYFISVVVIVGMINLFFSQTGIVNSILAKFGLEGENYLAQTRYFPHLYVWSGIWQSMGYSAIIYIAALAGVSPEYHEAAIIDGASRLQRIWHINLPYIRPTIVILLILSAGGIMSVGFEKVYLLQNAVNRTTSEVISTYVYEIGIKKRDFGLGSAIGLFNIGVNLIMLMLVNWVAKKLNDTALF
jgi:putative aldouronate transport system permease protein